MSFRIEAVLAIEMGKSVRRPIGDALSEDAEGFLINPCLRDLIALP
jgi:hypothetical protein